jgi:predicted amidophosphoribosyltransferase
MVEAAVVLGRRSVRGVPPKPKKGAMVCPTCGQTLRTPMLFCDKCGRSLA